MLHSFYGNDSVCCGNVLNEWSMDATNYSRFTSSHLKLETSVGLKSIQSRANFWRLQMHGNRFIWLLPPTATEIFLADGFAHLGIVAAVTTSWDELLRFAPRTASLWPIVCIAFICIQNGVCIITPQRHPTAVAPLSAVIASIRMCFAARRLYCLCQHQTRAHERCHSRICIHSNFI